MSIERKGISAMGLDIMSYDTKGMHFFLSVLDPRFSLANTYLSYYLESIFSCPFVPIYIRPYCTVEDDQKAINLSSDFNSIFIPEHEDFNIIFSSSPVVSELCSRLFQTQGEIFLSCFSTAFLKISDSRLIPIGPKPALATKYDSRINQWALLESLDIPTPQGCIYESFEEVEEAWNKGKYQSFFIYAEYSSGGFEVGKIEGKNNLERYKAHIRPKNLKNRFIVAEILDVWLSPNSAAIVVDKETVIVLSISDQILDGVRYIGNIYPSILADTELEKKLIDYTREIGYALAKEGFRGLFGCDFVVTKEKSYYVVDINPRKQGGYICNVLMWEKNKPKGYPGLVELEFNAVIGKKIGYNFEMFENPKLSFYWAHAKIKPYKKNMIIHSEIHDNSEEDCFNTVGIHFAKSFFPKGSYFIDGSMVGYGIMSDNHYDNLLLNLSRLREYMAKKIEGDNANKKI